MTDYTILNVYVSKGNITFKKVPKSFDTTSAKRIKIRVTNPIDNEDFYVDCMFNRELIPIEEHIYETFIPFKKIADIINLKQLTVDEIHLEEYETVFFIKNGEISYEDEDDESPYSQIHDFPHLKRRRDLNVALRIDECFILADLPKIDVETAKRIFNPEYNPTENLKSKVFYKYTKKAKKVKIQGEVMVVEVLEKTLVAYDKPVRSDIDVPWFGKEKRLNCLLYGHVLVPEFKEFYIPEITDKTKIKNLKKTLTKRPDFDLDFKLAYIVKITTDIKRLQENNLRWYNKNIEEE